MTKTVQGIAGDVKDMALAEQGKRKIEWANQQMPVLQFIASASSRSSRSRECACRRACT